METYSQELLQKHRESIILDLDVYHITDNLLASGFFNPDEFGNFSTLPCREDRVKALLDIIMRSQFEVYQVFVESLATDYAWLKEKLEIKGKVSESISDEYFEDCLSKGNVPRLPIHYVRRNTLEKELQMKLAELRPHSMITVLGTPGSGKSSLAISVIRNDPSFILNSCNGKIFWVNVGDCSLDAQIIILQSRLLRKILSTFKHININYNEQSTVTNNHTWKYYRDALKDAFEHNFLKGALLVIDDLKSKAVMEALSIGCKTMVTTHDKTLVNEFQPIYVEITGGLSQNESLKVIASYIEEDVGKLPGQAAKIHQLCKGAPFLIAMVGGVLAENCDILKHDKSQWNYYVEQIKNKDAFFCKIWRSADDHCFESAIQMCINSSGSEESIESYKLFAVLPSNVKLTTVALRVILNMPTARFESEIKQWKNKSLISERYNKDLKAYQYEIQDPIMAYLKSHTDKKTMCAMHVNLLQRYKKYCFQENLAYLPDDSYIAYHISYHIENTQNVDYMWDLYKTLYNDLIFIGSQIRLAGPAHVIKNLEAYLVTISRVGIEKTFIGELIKFILKHGHDLYQYPDTDIIQTILQHGSEGILYYKAFEIVQHDENKNTLYLQFQFNEDMETADYVRVDVPGEVICVIRYLSKSIFLGNKKGNVSVWNEDFTVKLKKYQGTSSPIQSIEFNNKRPYKMATTNSDGIVKVWHIDDCYEEKDSAEIEGRSPTLANSSNSLLTMVHPSGPCKGASWGHNTDILLVHTNPGGAVILYDSDGNKVIDKMMDFDITVVKSILSGDDSLIIIGVENWNKEKFGIHIYTVEPFNQVITFSEKWPLIYFAVLPNHPGDILALATKSLHRWKILKSTEDNTPEPTQNIDASLLDGTKDEYSFYTGIVSDGGSCIFISTTDCRILVYNLESCVLIKEWNDFRGVVSCMDTFLYNDEMALSHILITVSNDVVQAIKLWCVKSFEIVASFNTFRKAKLSMKFDCIFNKEITYPSLTTDIDNILRQRATTLNINRQKITPGFKKNVKTYSWDRKISLSQHWKPVSHINNTCSNRSSGDLKSNTASIIAVINSSNKVNTLFGKKLIAETSEAENTITSVAISPCGQYLVYAQENGIINKFVWKNNNTKLMINLNDQIHNLEFVDCTTLTVIGEKNIFTVLIALENECSIKTVLSSDFESIAKGVNSPDHSGLSTCIRSPTSPSILSSSLKDNPIILDDLLHNKRRDRMEYVVKCFLIQDNSLVLSVTRDGNVKLWSENSEFLCHLITSNKGSELSCVTLQNSKLLVTCFCSGSFSIYNLIGNKEGVSLTAHLFDSSEKLDRCITSCCVSYDCKILALGQESGDIVIWHITAKSFITILNFDKSPVTDLKFSPAPYVDEEASGDPKKKHLSVTQMTSSSDTGEKSDDDTPLILVSLAGQIAWWNINYLLAAKKSLKRKNNTLRALTSMPVSSPSNKFSLMEFDEFMSFTNPLNKNSNSVEKDWECLWKEKSYRKYAPRKELMACLKLIGDKAEKIMVDDMFEKFVTIDNSGTVYIMNVFDSSKGKIQGRPYSNSEKCDLFF